MKLTTLTAGVTLTLLAWGASADNRAPQLYVNQNLGFNIEGFNYTQNAFPCDIDKALIDSIVEQSKAQNIRMEAVGTADKIRNGVIPVLAIDVEQLVLNKDYKFGTKTKSNLPRVQVTAGLIKGNNLVSAKHSCAIATLNEFTPSSNILDMGNTATVCSATRKCLRDLSRDIVQWVAPQVK